ncbi:hypothetical protein Dxin01_01076 [Deinococcus xinjiangensis]|uniref:DUF3995 domain-containing protein n=1 Tax=Deinococcus xinjiangensis TaxID=457454 RepID=A0ABP9V7T8_9DEIO
MTNPSSALQAAQLALTIGLVHAGFSLYWALGGRWLLNTVGKGPEEMLRASALGAPAALALIALFKALAAVIPWLNTQGKLPWPRLWRGISWAGGVFLVLYGGVNTLAAWGVLLGVIHSDGYDRTAMQGHAFLWDPLFFQWGAALLYSLWLSRTEVAAKVQQ